MKTSIPTRTCTSCRTRWIELGTRRTGTSLRALRSAARKAHKAFAIERAKPREYVVLMPEEDEAEVAEEVNADLLSIAQDVAAIKKSQQEQAKQMSDVVSQLNELKELLRAAVK